MGIPAPRARALVAWAGVVCAAAVLALAADSGSADARQPAPGPQAEPERGGELYQRWCAVCHATDGAGTAAGPPINGASIALVDLTMRTGSMPLTDKGRGVREREFTDAEREATLAYMVERFDLDGHVEAPGAGDVVTGQDLYTLHCAQCHGATGEGGAAGSGATVPAARGAGPILVAQAVRAGPFQMPRFSHEQLTDDELDDIVAFLDHEPSTTPLGLVELSRVAAFAWAMLLGAVILAACWWIDTAAAGGRPASNPGPADDPNTPDDPGPAVPPSSDHDAKGPTP